MKLIQTLVLMILLQSSSITYAQNHNQLDTITDNQNSLKQENLPLKLQHAEPLFIDLIRDLGARKGEKEWNVGIGITDHQNYDSYEALVEYEWAPIDRLGFEIELPFTINSKNKGYENTSMPSSRLNSIKLATQWTFLVNEKWNTSMALGYINEFELSDFKNFGQPLFTGNVYNPFLVVAKRLNNQLHSLLYTGPKFEHHFKSKSIHTTYDLNASMHYMIEGSKNFIGVELNNSFDKKDFDLTIRPQMRLVLSEQTMVGVVVGVPVKKENEKMSAFLRIIWEPKHS